MGILVHPGGEISRERSARYVGRHHHVRPYAAIVLRGGYVEAGDRGRFRTEAGDALLHGWFEAHQDHFRSGGADILNLPLADVQGPTFGRLCDPDEIVRMAERDVREAADCLMAQFTPVAPVEPDWPDRLAESLANDDVENLGDWAERMGLAASSVSRGFRLAYGVSPRRFRTEQRASRAARALRRQRLDLAAIAVESGFSDQPHMNRMVKRVFGLSPRSLRDVKCVQDDA